MLDQNKMKYFVYFKDLLSFHIFAIYQLTPLNIPDDKTENLLKLEAFADDNFKLAQKMELIFDGEMTLGK